MKLTIGQKIGITLAAIVVFAGATAGTVFGVKKAKEKASQNPGSSVVVTPQPDNKTDDNKTDDNKQDDQKQDDNKQDDQKQDEDKKTEKDYMNECQDKIEEIALEKLQSTSKRGTFDNINILKINELNGKVYLTADKTLTGITTTSFYELDLGKNFENSTYEQSLKILNSISSVSGTELTTQTVLQKAVSEELYNQLCDYVLDKVGLEGAQILNATKFTSQLEGYYTNLICIKDNKIYNVYANVNSYGSQSDHINNLMNEGIIKEIKITSEENFKEFVTESTAQASAQSNVVYFDITFPSFNNETNKETTKTFTVRQTNGKADYRGLSL